MNMYTESSETRELDHRATDGVEVALLWYPGTDVVSVRVDDARGGESFELVLCEGVRPLEVFQHPYPYAGQYTVPITDASTGTDIGRAVVHVP